MRLELPAPTFRLRTSFKSIQLEMQPRGRSLASEASVTDTQRVPISTGAGLAAAAITSLDLDFPLGLAAVVNLAALPDASWVAAATVSRAAAPSSPSRWMQMRPRWMDTRAATEAASPSTAAVAASGAVGTASSGDGRIDADGAAGGVEGGVRSEPSRWRNAATLSVARGRNADGGGGAAEEDETAELAEADGAGDECASATVACALGARTDGSSL